MPLIQWVILNLSEVGCFIQSNSALVAIASVKRKAQCLITSDSQLTCDAIVTPSAKPKPNPGFENDPNNLTGVYAILPNFFNEKKYRYVSIDFTFNGSTYHSEFYSDKEITVGIDKIKMTTANRAPAVSLKKIEGLHGKTYNL